MEASKSENLSFRLTPSMKKDLLQRSLELKLQPAEYLLSLIEKDLLSKSQELPDRDKTFIEKQFNSFSDKLLMFFVENIDKKLQTIEQKISSGLQEQDPLEKYMTRIELYAKERKVKLQEETKRKWKNTLSEAIENATVSIEHLIESARAKPQNS
jgi:hypothetical protein